ncbi:MAG TPA: DUF488 family protein [Pseudolysinimonas sp.]|jgi:uncharacterized protein YeaO (DUF488 family)
MTVQIKRVYETPDPLDGYRVLVDRLWPRGLSKEHADVDLWLKDVAPSPDLRTWWDHDPDRMEQFATRYRDELELNPAVAQLREVIAAHPVVSLLYGAHDPTVNHARILLAWVER